MQGFFHKQDDKLDTNLAQTDNKINPDPGHGNKANSVVSSTESPGVANNKSAGVSLTVFLAGSPGVAPQAINTGVPTIGGSGSG